MRDDTIAFIGGGNMTGAIASGLVQDGVHPEQLCIAEPLEARRAELAQLLPGAEITDDNSVAAYAGPVLVLAVKPQILPQVCRGIATIAQATRPLVISIAAGVRAADIVQWLGGNLPLVRVMPNQPALLREGISAMFANEHTGTELRVRADTVLKAVGATVWLDNEAQMDAATAVSGSGPAYFFLLISMLSDAGRELGLGADAAMRLAVQTARGSAALAMAENASMDELIARVRSPGGTTAAALDSLDGDNVRAIFSRAVTAACDRAKVLADNARDSDS